MGHAIIFLLLGIIGLLCPKETKQRLMDQEATEWYAEIEREFNIKI